MDYDALMEAYEDDEEPEGVIRLADGEYGIISTLQCIYCGCTNTRACTTENGACFWISDEPPICSGCAYNTAVM